MPRNLQTGITGDLSTDAPGSKTTGLAGSLRVAGFTGRKVKGKPGSETPPSFSTSPAIIGSPTVGLVTSYTPGTVSGSPAPTVTREWLLDGTPIAGATAATYTPITGDATHSLSVRETAVNVAGVAQRTSAGVSVLLNAATAVTLSGPTTGATGSAIAYWVTPNGALTINTAVNISAPGASLSTAVLNFASGSSAAQMFTVTRATDGTTSVSITNNAGLTNAGTPISFTSGVFTWQFSDSATLTTGANTTTPLAINLPAGATYYASPDLLPGQTLSVTGSTLNLVGDSTVPTVNGSTAGSPIDTISARDVVIEVMDSPLAIANHIRSGSLIATYGAGQSSSIMYAIKNYTQDGDIIEISPGATCASLDSSNTPSGQTNGYLEGSGLLIFNSLTLRGMTGRGRWRLFPPSINLAGTAYSGIVIAEPAQVGGKNLTVTVQDFDITDQTGDTRDAYSFRVRNDSAQAWSSYHTLVTIRNFKIGKTSGMTGSGVQGGAQSLVVEDGDVFDCGQSGYEHNFYVSGRYLTMRGVRSRRTRNANGTPGSMDGHILKSRHANATIEGCLFEGYGAADNSDVVQCANGGNWTFTGCVFIQGATPSSNNGIIVYENEQAGNQPWYYGAEGHSLTVRGNVFINRAPASYGGLYPMAMINFRGAGGASGVSGYTFVCSDNIGANIDVAPSNWIQNASPSVDWTTNNSSETYSSTDAAFSNTTLRLYTRAAGTISATGGAITTKRFVWPHGYVSRSDSFRGLG